MKRELKERGLSIAGNKTELQERLQAAMDGEPLLEDTSITGEDILDEEEGVLSDEEKILGADENELLKSPAATPTTLLPKATGESSDAALVDDDILESPTTTAKKVVLKRKISCGQSSEASSVTTKENTEPTAEKVTKVSERIPITVEGTSSASSTTKKLSELSMQERLELRAKKFGIDAAAAATAATTKDASAISQAPVVSSEKQVEILKKRAERFGCVTSTNLVKLDTEEKLLKRKQRFGGEIKAPSGETATEANSDEWSEKARKRLERFGGGANAKTTTPEAVTSTTPATVATAASN